MSTAGLKPAAMLAAALLCGSCAGTARDSQGDVQSRQAEQVSAHEPPAGVIPSKPASAADVLAAAQVARQSFTTGAAPSVDALMNEFVQALTDKDKAALTRLRVTKNEYVDLIIPGTVPVGQPPRLVSEQPREYYWSLLDTKSYYYTENLIGQFGGRAYRGHTLRFSRPTKQYAWYSAVGQVRLELEGDDDHTYHVLTGWLAEVDGKYKFISYEYND